MRYKRWDIYIAYVKFVDSDEGKLRPIIIYNETQAFVISIKISSQQPRPEDFTITDWKGAGLDKPSVARLNEMVSVPKLDIRQRLGRLSDKDIQLLAFKAQITP